MKKPMSSVSIVAAMIAGISLVTGASAQAPAPVAQPAAQAMAVNPLQLKVGHITGNATDIDRAVAWYQQKLGFKLDNRGERQNGQMKFAELSIPGFGVALVQFNPAGAAPAAAAPAAAAPAARPTWVHIVLTVPDLPRAFEELKRRGANPHTRGNAPIDTVPEFLVNDSEGNEIEIGKAPAK